MRWATSAWSRGVGTSRAPLDGWGSGAERPPGDSSGGRSRRTAGGGSREFEMEITTGLLAVVAVMSLFCGYVDASLGMGYGTTLTPILLIAGFAPLEVVPAVLLGQIAGGLVGGLAHHRMGNINLDFRRD